MQLLEPIPIDQYPIIFHLSALINGVFELYCWYFRDFPSHECRLNENPHQGLCPDLGGDVSPH